MPFVAEVSEPHIALIFKSHTHLPQVSHTGLGNCALNTSKVLQQNGYFAVPVGVRHMADANAYLTQNPGVTHVVISALWAKPDELTNLTAAFPRTRFAVVCHSNWSFLQAEPAAITLFKQMVSLEQSKLNFQAAGNSAVFAKAASRAFMRPCQFIPNLYYLDATNDPAPPVYTGGTIRACMFGALRDQKNPEPQMVAAMIMGNTLKVPVEFHVSTGRNDGGVATRLLNALRNTVAGSPYVKLVEDNWMPLDQLQILAASMHIGFQVSVSESFNQICADLCSRGVPLVIGPAISWAPPHWHANPDDASDIADVAMGLLGTPSAGRDGMIALQNHNALGLQAWVRWIEQGQSTTALWHGNGIPLRFQGRRALQHTVY